MIKEGLYEFGPDNMALNVYTYKKGFLNVLGCDLFIRAGEFNFRLDIKGENAAESKIDLHVKSDSLKAVAAVSDGRMNENILTEENKKEIASNINGKKILDAEKYPEIIFISRNVSAETDALKVKGDLVIRDKAEEIELTLKKNPDKSGNKLRGSIDLKQSKFGIRPFTAMFGTLCLQDQITIEWELEIPL